MREGPRGIVAKTEAVLNERNEAEKHANYLVRSNSALATIVLAVDPFLPYPRVDPVEIWRKLSGQFERTKANKLSLRKKLFNMKLGDGTWLSIQALWHKQQICSQASPFVKSLRPSHW